MGNCGRIESKRFGGGFFSTMINIIALESRTVMDDIKLPGR